MDRNRPTVAQLLALALLSASLALPACTSKPSREDAQRKPVGTGIGTEQPVLVGSIDFEVRDQRGKLKDERHLKNLVVNAGKAATAGLINGVITNFFEHVAIGTGTTAAAAGDTACETEIASGGGSRAAGTTSRVTTDVTNDTAQVELTYNFTSSFAVTESCLLDSASSGTLLSRQVFSAINVANGDSLLIRWKIDVD